MGNKLLYSVFVLALLTVGLASAYVPTWTVDKSVVVTGDYVWDGGSWTLPSPRPVTATYGFQASGVGYGITYNEAEAMGSAWKYKFNNILTADDRGEVHSFADIVTVNDMRYTPGTAMTDYAFGTQNDGAFSHSTIVLAGHGFATIDHSASFTGAFTSQNFVCVNDCTD